MPASNQLNTLVTVSEMAEACGVKNHNVEHVLLTYGLKPLQVAGCTRLFARNTLLRVKKELLAIQIRGITSGRIKVNAK